MLNFPKLNERIKTKILEIVSWKIIRENQRKFADKSYYLNAERECAEGTLVLEVSWPQGMYAITVYLIHRDKKRSWIFFKKENRELLYSCFVTYNDRVEKYGHQLMRIADDSPISKFKRLDSLQKDAVLNWTLFSKHKVEFTTSLPKAKSL